MAETSVVGEMIYEQLRECANEPVSFNELENLGGQIGNKVVREALGKWIQGMEGSVPEPTTRCRNCGKDSNYVAKRPGVKQTSFGSIRYLRAYYVCPHCFQHTCPLDERLDPYESLARMRKRINAGESLQVSNLAQSWGLGSILTSHNVTRELVSETLIYSASSKEGVYPSF